MCAYNQDKGELVPAGNNMLPLPGYFLCGGMQSRHKLRSILYNITRVAHCQQEI